MFPFETDVAKAICFTGLVPDHFKRLPRKRQEVLLVLLEQFGNDYSLLVVYFSRLLRMLVQVLLIEFLDIMVCGNWYKQISSIRPNLVLNIALFM